MTSHTLYMTCLLLCMISHSLYGWHRTMYLWHHTQYIYEIISNIHDTIHNAFMMTQRISLTFHPLYLTSCPLYLCHHTHSIDDITANICMISHPVFVWHPIHCIYGIFLPMYDITTLCADDTTLVICMTSFALQMTSQQTTQFMMSHPLQAWQNNHLTHCIFVIITSPLISHPLWYDITPTTSVISYALYTTSYPHFMTTILSI